MGAWYANIEYWHWLSFAVILGILDVLIGSNFFFVWCGIAAAAIGALLFVMPPLSWEMQFLLFGIGVFCSFFVWRHFAKLSKGTEKNSTLNQRASQYIGRVFTLDEAIVNGRGRVRVDDSYWRVEGEELPKGQKVKVVDADGVVLRVEKSD